MQEFEFERRVMGSDAVLSIVSTDAKEAARTAAHLFACATDTEERMSRFSDKTELSHLNAERTRRMSPEFLATLRIGVELHTRSHGVFNPLFDISRFGYDADISVVKGASRTGSKHLDPYNTNMEDMIVDAGRSTVTLKEGQRLDFGGFLKGHTAELLARNAGDVPGIIVNLGGDIFTRGRDTDGRAFEFIVENPVHPLETIHFTYTDGAIATSGPYNRHWTYNGKKYSHVLSDGGRTNPDSGLVSTTVLAPRGADADAFATVALILGEDEGGRVLTEQGFEYCFIRNDGSAVLSEGFPVLTIE